MAPSPQTASSILSSYIRRKLTLRGLVTTFLDVIILVAAWTHVFLAPYTKVEESFNLHATHDIISYGTVPGALHNYDHNAFPGAVPRTFTGGVILAHLTQILTRISNQMKPVVYDKADIQIFARISLVTWNALGLILLRTVVQRRFGFKFSVYFTLLTMTQFHLPFWMGRTLPNMFALLPVNVATALLIAKRPRPSVTIALLTFTTVVFRSEVLLLLCPIVLQLFMGGSITLRRVILVGLLSGTISLAITVSVDSYFWGQPYLWPEFSGLYFNVYQGKSAEWGTSPRFAYWTSHLPKLLLSSLPLSVIGYLQDQRMRDLLFPFLSFITLISFLGHKEWRFIIYVVPAFNIVAANGARYLTTITNRTTLFGKLVALSCMPILLGLNIALTFILTLTSIHNYPGGEALVLIHKLYPVHPPAHIHISNLAAQTGASLFLHKNAPPYPNPIPSSAVASPPWIYDKTENLTIKDLTANLTFTHLIVEERPDDETRRNWEIVASVEGFERWSVDWSAVKSIRKGSFSIQQTWTRVRETVKMVKQEKLWILQRKS